MNVAITVIVTDTKTWEKTQHAWEANISKGDARADIFITFSENTSGDYAKYTDIYFWDDDYQHLLRDGSFEFIAEAIAGFEVDCCITERDNV